MSEPKNGKALVFVTAALIVGVAVAVVIWLLGTPRQTQPTQPASPAKLMSATASEDSGAGPAQGALDGNMVTFWEAAGAFPFWVQASYADDFTARRYSMATGNHGIGGSDSTVRMPKTWNLQCSQDGQNWTEVDTRSGQTLWKPDEMRSYVIASPRQCRSYRLNITEGNHPEILRIYDIQFSVDGG